MEAISSNGRNGIVQAYGKHEPSTHISTSRSSDTPTTTNLTDLSDLAKRAETTGEDVRPDVIKRAQALLADPNWPNDSDLEGLSEKLLTTEDFSG